LQTPGNKLKTNYSLNNYIKILKSNIAGMSSHINRIFGSNLEHQSLNDEIPYQARSVYELTYGDKELTENKGYAGLDKLIGKQVIITYIKPNTLITSELTGVLKDFRIDYIRISNEHTFNLIILRMRDGRELIFVDGELKDLNSNEAKSASGIIRQVKPVNP